MVPTSNTTKLNVTPQEPQHEHFSGLEYGCPTGVYYGNVRGYQGAGQNVLFVVTAKHIVVLVTASGKGTGYDISVLEKAKNSDSDRINARLVRTMNIGIEV